MRIGPDPSRRFYTSKYNGHNIREYLDKIRFSRTRITRVMELAAIKPCGRLLDLGCGLGTFMIEGSIRGTEMIGLDLKSEIVSIATEGTSKWVGLPLSRRRGTHSDLSRRIQCLQDQLAPTSWSILRTPST